MKRGFRKFHKSIPVCARFTVRKRGDKVILLFRKCEIRKNVVRFKEERM